MTRRFLILLLLPLAACATPQQQCQNTATRDLRVLDQLIAETELNLSRGYAVEEEVVPAVGFTYCLGNDGHRFGGMFCTGGSTRVRERAVAIDPAAERAKLASLRDTRGEVATRSQAALAACRAQYGA